MASRETPAADARGPLAEPLPTKPDPLLHPWDWKYQVHRSPATGQPRIITAGAGQPEIGHVKWCRTMFGARFGAWRRNLGN